MAIRLYENFRALLYTPFFAAHALGAYEAEGVAVELKASPEPGLGARQVLAGEAELTWGGPMRVQHLHAQQPDCGLVCFSEVIGRDPFSLVGRTPRPSFRLTDLADVTFGSVSEVPTPWLCLQDDIRRAGLDPTTLKHRVADRSMADNLAAVIAGKLDAAQLFEPYVTQALDAGCHVWHAAASRGVTAYTCFYTTRPTIERHRDEFRRMTRAIYRTQKWLHAQPPATIAARVTSFFPDIPLGTLTTVIEHYLALGIWNKTPVLPQEGWDRLRDAVVSGGLVRQGIDYARGVDPTFAEQAVADNPPSL
ncbi:MAG: ABC transporter substrate-binding protein [Pseudomonadota bacterium]